MNANRGMFLETIIERTISYFTMRKIAHLSKRHLPIKVFSFKGNRVEGWIKSRTQTDYYGIYRGHYLDFEAKQTKEMSLPLSNIKKHQLSHMQQVHKYGAVVFLIVYFQRNDTIYLLPYEALKKFFELDTKRQSIPINFFKEHGYEVEILYPGVLALQDVLDELISNKKI